MLHIVRRAGPAGSTCVEADIRAIIGERHHQQAAFRPVRRGSPVREVIRAGVGRVGHGETAFHMGAVSELDGQVGSFVGQPAYCQFLLIQ